MAKSIFRTKRAKVPPVTVLPEPGEQSGSAGRDPGPPSDNPGVDGKPGTGDNTGQGNYGQSGFGQGGYRKGGDAVPNYQKDVAGRDPRSKSSNHGSGRPDSEGEDE